jgi:hypothetical protein
MTRRSQRIAVTAMAGLAAAGLAACSSSSNNSSSSGGKPVHGGTLKIVAASGPDHIDTVPAYYTADYILERGYARQLLTYPTVPDPTLTSAGWTVGNLDLTIFAQEPKLGPHKAAMRANLAKLLGIAESAVSVKAKTGEGVGHVGRGEVIACHAIVLVEIKN